MTTRLLPPAEWGRLTGTETESATKLPSAQIVVVEDESGTIVGSWALFPVWHAEGIWVAREHRGKGSVLRRLIASMRRLADSASVDVVWTASKSEVVAEIMARIRARVVPGTHYVIPVHGDEHGA